MTRAKGIMSILPRAGSPWVLATLLLVIGLSLLLGGVQLLLLGGSAYYAVTGLAVTASALLLWRGRKFGMWLYIAMLAWTVLWTLWEVGFDGWGLAARLIAPFVLGLWFLPPPVRRGLV